MKSKSKTLFGATCLMGAFTAFVAIGAVSSGSGSRLLAEVNHVHDGYHYAEAVATSTATGNAEFYTCCGCHETWLAKDKPTSGNYVDRSIDGAVGGYDNFKYYYVNLDANGGNGGTTFINNAMSTDVLPSVTVPTKDSSSFQGYFSEQDGGTQYIDASGAGVKAWDLGNAATLYAHWAHVHSYSKVAEVPATTVSDGVAEHYVCSSCGKLFKYADGAYTEVSDSDLVLSKIPAEWNGDIDFATYCTNGSSQERVSASVVNNKLRFTMIDNSHYGEYRSALYYKIKKSDTKKYLLSISDVSWSSGCDLNVSGGYPGNLVIFVVNNGTRTTVSNYYYPDSNYKYMDLTDYVKKNEDNEVQVIIQCVYGNNGDKKDEYVEIGKISMISLDTEEQFETRTYDVASMMTATETEHINYSTDGGKLTLTTSGVGDTWGTVYPISVWTTESIENAYIKFTISEITSGASVVLQLDYLDRATTDARKYINCGQSTVGTYTVPLASNECASLTGEHSFRFRFGVQGGTDVSVVISSIELCQVDETSWSGNVDFANFAAAGFEERVSASYEGNGLRLTKYGQYHYGHFWSYNRFNVNKEDNKTYKMFFSDISFSSDAFTLKQINVCYALNGATSFTHLKAYVYDSAKAFEVDFTDVLNSGSNSLQLILQICLGNDGETVTGYVDIGNISLVTM